MSLNSKDKTMSLRCFPVILLVSKDNDSRVLLVFRRVMNPSVLSSLMAQSYAGPTLSAPPVKRERSEAIW